ncbi:MAG TPA: translational GTPase TypA, partial [Patescibacteria group bacterium]|nr:translational GTPase TypA [Patescibacteria group bacterium]
EDGDSFLVSGRGELHLAILLEQMRRGSYELMVSRPEVIIREIDGVKMEPFESLTIEVPESYSGSVMDMVGRRKGIIENMNVMESGEQHFEFLIPSRGLLGLKNALMIATKGTAQMHHTFLKYAPVVEGLDRPTHGSMVSMETGKAVGYALWKLQERGSLFVSPGDDVYVGMVLGESNRETDDMNVNPIKEKKLTNVRSKASDEAITLIPPKKLTLETAIEFIDKDEYLEVTPSSLRIRKKMLDPNKRKR